MEKYFNKKDMVKMVLERERVKLSKKRTQIEPNIDDIVADLGL